MAQELAPTVRASVIVDATIERAFTVFIEASARGFHRSTTSWSAARAAGPVRFTSSSSVLS
jgi:hypothetical protein